MEKKELEQLTVIELKKMAKKKNVSLKRGLKKAEIVNLILETLKEKEKPRKVKKVIRIVKPKLVKAIEPKVKKVTKKVEKKVTKPEIKIEEKLERPVPPPTPKRLYTPEEMVEEAKYFEPFEVPYPPKEELPKEYGENKIVVMARDPNWAFAYWEITPQTLEESRRKAGEGANLTLRVYDITGIDFDGKNALSFFDIGVYERAGNWYIELGKPDRSFCVDVGLLNPEGSFITIARSNVITTPRDKISEITDERWMIMEEEFQKVFALSGGYGIGVSSPELQEIVKKRFAAEIFSPKK